MILRPRTSTRETGTCISILAGGKSNYFHAMIEGVARLSMLQPDLIAQADRLLVTEGAVAQSFALGRLSLPSRLKQRRVADTDSLWIEETHISLEHQWRM